MSTLRIVVTLVLSVFGGYRLASGQAVCATTGLTPGYLPSEEETRILGTVLEVLPPDTLAPPQAATPLSYSHDFYKPSGHRIFVDAIGGPGASGLGPDSMITIVRWTGPDDSCKWTLERDSLAIGSRHMFRATIRPDSMWISDDPTFDVDADAFREYPGPPPPLRPPSLKVYREFLSTMPSRAEWENDCRPGVLRVESWLRENPDARLFSPFAIVDNSIRRFCDDWLQRHAERMERGKSTRPIPETLRTILAELDCQEDEWHSWEDAIDGSFVEGNGQQWVVVCSRPEHWRLLIILPDSPSRVVELARMAGYDWIWEVAVAPPEYFDWTSSDEIGVDDQWSVPPPERDIVVVEFLADMGNPGKFAFYETETGWVQAGVRCCRWPK